MHAKIQGLSQHTVLLTLHKICIHSRILGNDAIDQLAIFIVDNPPPCTTLLVRTIHTSPFWHFKILTKRFHTTLVMHLEPYVQNEYVHQLIASILPQYPYIAKRMNNPLVHSPVSDYFCSTPQCTNAQITQMPMLWQSHPGGNEQPLQHDLVQYSSKLRYKQKHGQSKKAFCPLQEADTCIHLISFAPTHLQQYPNNHIQQGCMTNT